MKRMIEIRNRNEEFSGIFWPKKIAESQEEVFIIECDICGKDKQYSEKVFIGLCTGYDRDRVEIKSLGFFEFIWGYKKNIAHSCIEHTEKQIKSWVDSVVKSGT